MGGGELLMTNHQQPPFLSSQSDLWSQYLLVDRVLTRSETEYQTSSLNYRPQKSHASLRFPHQNDRFVYVKYWLSIARYLPRWNLFYTVFRFRSSSPIKLKWILDRQYSCHVATQWLSWRAWSWAGENDLMLGSIVFISERHDRRRAVMKKRAELGNGGPRV